MNGVVLDTSAVVAIVDGEPGAGSLADAIESASPRMMSAATLVELGLVYESRIGPVGAAVIERFLREASIDVRPVDRLQADRALEGWRRFGKGRHRARLNLGDCFVYALASATGFPVVCVGDDFAATDLPVVRPVPD